MNEPTFIIGNLAGTKAREMEPVKEPAPGELKHFPFDRFMNEHSIKKRASGKKRGSGIMKSEFDDGCEDNLAENSLPAVSLGLELNERPVVCRQLRDPDRAAVHAGRPALRRLSM